MPNKDKTGPLGAGPKTGRGLGSCQGKATNTENRPINRKAGRKMGLGRGKNR